MATNGRDVNETPERRKDERCRELVTIARLVAVVHLFEMRRSGSMAVSALAVVMVCGGGCGGGGSSGSPIPTGPSAVSAEVEFEYGAIFSSTDVPSTEGLGCSGVARIYPSWWGFTHATMIPAGPGNWVALFEDVPVGGQSVRIEPPIGCTTTGVAANALPLSVAENSTFTFTVHPNGSVTN